MSEGFIKRSLLIVCLGVCWLAAAPVHAGLGGGAQQVRADADLLGGIAESASLQDYVALQISADSGMRVREFLNRDGVVFAVSWSGPAMPDLQRLLGVHFAAYRGALARLDHPGMHRSLRIVTPDLVVESGGHLRAYAGRAYLPALIPAGVALADLH